MKTLEQAEKEYCMTYYKDDCEFCKNHIVMSIDELNNPTFYGQPPIQKDENMYKCPVCGHVNVRKIVDLQPCFQNGGTNINFELTDEETKKVQDFKKEHEHKEITINSKSHIKSIEQFTYSLTPCIHGYHIKVRCNECGIEKEIC